MQIYFNPIMSLNIQLRLEDKNLLAQRIILKHEVNYRGNKINTSFEQNTTKTTSTQFIVELQQEQFVEADLTKNCAVYPTEQFQTYSDCDTHSVLGQFDPDLVPFWTTANTSRVTTTPKSLEQSRLWTYI